MCVRARMYATMMISAFDCVTLGEVWRRWRVENTIRRQHLVWTIYFSGLPSAGNSSSSSNRSRSRVQECVVEGEVYLTYYIPIMCRASPRWMLGSYIMCKHARNFWEIGWCIFTASPLYKYSCATKTTTTLTRSPDHGPARYCRINKRNTNAVHCTTFANYRCCYNIIYTNTPCRCII